MDMLNQNEPKNAYDKLSSEQEAIENIYSAIESLDHSQKIRVLDYVKSFCTEEYLSQQASELTSEHNA
jgi:hypothetical protein